MIRLQNASKAASDKGRKYIGLTDGEDLQANFRPSWSRTPQLDVVVGEGSFENRLKDAVQARKVRSEKDRVDFPSFANFQGHLLDWGVKMIITKVLTPVELVAYQLVLVRVAEEHGGVRTAYMYDLLLRRAVAKSLEVGEDSVSLLLPKVDRDVLQDAQSKVLQQSKDSQSLLLFGGGWQFFAKPGLHRHHHFRPCLLRYCVSLPLCRLPS